MVNLLRTKAGKYRALTIVRRGRLSKTHLSDPEVGLPMESKVRQEVAVPVELIPVRTLDPSEVNGQASKDEGVPQEDEVKPEEG